MLAPELFLERIAAMLRSDIGPAVTEPFPRTQAFMAAVILERLAKQVQRGAADAAAEEQELSELYAELAPSAPPALAAALASARARGGRAGLCGVIEALYGARPELGDERFEAVRARVRRTLRAQLDRYVAVAG